jgi:hypothetical protein
MSDPRWDDARNRGDDARDRACDGREQTRDPRDLLLHGLDLPLDRERELVLGRYCGG